VFTKTYKELNVKKIVTILMGLLFATVVYAKSDEAKAKETRSPANDSEFKTKRKNLVKNLTDMYYCTDDTLGPKGDRFEYAFGEMKKNKLILTRTTYDPLPEGMKAEDQNYREEVIGHWGFSYPEAELLVCFGQCGHGSPDWRKFSVDANAHKCSYVK
jgi:hypothetical protein